MLNKICSFISQSKNTLMLITTGIYVLALYCTLSENVLIFSGIIFVLFIFLLLKNQIPAKYIITWIIIFFIGIANTSARLKQADALLSLAPLNSDITGKVVTIPQGKSEGKIKFFFNVNKLNFNSVEKTFNSEKLLVSINETPENKDKLKEIKLYNTLKLNGRLSKPFKASNPSQFDYGNYLRNHNAYAVFYANDVEVIKTKHSNREKFLQKVNDYRENVIKLHSQYLKSPNLEIIGGIVFGDDAVSPPKNIKQSFINSGLLHILAASGMNVAFIYGFFFFLMSLFRVKFKVRVIIGMAMVVIYSLMTGLGASVIRATCMLLFVLIGKLIDRDAHSIALLSFVALLMLLYNPLWINDVGFQLSFVVTFGILLMAPAFGKFKSKIADFLVSTITIPIIAQLWVIPIQIFYFNNISLYSVFANIMSVPIVMLLSFGGFISSLLASIKPIAEFICMTIDFILNPLVNLLINISDFWGKMPHSAIQTTHPSVFQIIIYYFVLLFVSVLLYKELRVKYLKKVLIAIGTLLIILGISIIPAKNHDLEITAFDVGNADCFLIKTPENKYIMIDTGKFGYNGGKSQAEIILIKYLKDRGINTLESIIVTHFDNDHCGGALDLLNTLKVNKIYVNDLNHESTAAYNIYKAAKEHNTEQVLAKNNQIVYNYNGLKITNLSNYNGKSDNDNSIITLLKYKDFTMLFTGDAGIAGIQSVINNIPSNITVLKAPHHGAIGGINKELIEHLNPKYTIISTGINQFGHPSLYTLELLKSSTILRTDINNSIRLKINNKRKDIYCYDIKSKKYKKFN